ncbi:MAG TPA: hypothetical protein VJ488_05655 [Dehalococcoidia bacterium]|nr:hypothetical protein [Dehalococcoidia bacterium]
MQLCIIDIAQDKGLSSIYGIVLKDNASMLGLCKKLGFSIHDYSKDEIRISLEL